MNTLDLDQEFELIAAKLGVIAAEHFGATTGRGVLVERGIPREFLAD